MPTTRAEPEAHRFSLVMEDEVGDLFRCSCGAQDWDFAQGREAYERHLSAIATAADPAPAGASGDWLERAQYAVGGYGSPADGDEPTRTELRASITEAIADEDCRDAVAWKMGWEAAMYTFTAADPAPAGDCEAGAGEAGEGS